MDYSLNDEYFLGDLRLREIVVQFHIVDTGEGNYNYSVERGKHVISDLLEAANRRWTVNDPMHLPVGNNLPVYDAEIRLIAAGERYTDRHTVLHHSVKDAFYRKKGPKSNRFSEALMNHLADKDDSLLHIFLLPFDPQDLKEGRQVVETTGVAIGNRIKLAGLYESGLEGWQYAGLLNHEVGHVLGLRHTWNGGDGCEDTPTNNNCWNQTDDVPCSNNLMDYNAHQSAITPCQISKMHIVLSRPYSRQRRLLVRDWCTQIPDRDRVVVKSETWLEPRDLAGNLIIRPGASLQIGTAVSFPPGASVIVEKGGTLILTSASLYQACGMRWNGIRVHKKGKILADHQSELLDCSPDLS